jgi:hypothetical protein
MLDNTGNLDLQCLSFLVYPLTIHHIILWCFYKPCAIVGEEFLVTAVVIIGGVAISAAIHLFFLPIRTRSLTTAIEVVVIIGQVRSLAFLVNDGRFTFATGFVKARVSDGDSGGSTIGSYNEPLERTGIECVGGALGPSKGPTSEVLKSPGCFNRFANLESGSGEEALWR